MGKFNVGDKVRILDVDAIDFGSKYWNNGDVTEVVLKYADGDVYLKRTLSHDFGATGDELLVFKEEFHAIEKVSEDYPQLSDEIEELKRRVAELESKLADKESPEIKFSVTADELAELVSKESPNELRKRSIEKAKKFVEGTERKALNSNGNTKGNGTYVERTTIPEYIINEDKRTVVVLAKGAIIPILYEKGIAKCAPDDVFNADIGKAIALGRAYGLDVSEFEQAPQPGEVVAGMKVEVKGNIKPYVGTVFSGDNAKLHSVGSLREEPNRLIRIISDTGAEY